VFCRTAVGGFVTTFAASVNHLRFLRGRFGGNLSPTARAFMDRQGLVDCSVTRFSSNFLFLDDCYRFTFCTGHCYFRIFMESFDILGGFNFLKRFPIMILTALAVILSETNGRGGENEGEYCEIR